MKRKQYFPLDCFQYLTRDLTDQFSLQLFNVIQPHAPARVVGNLCEKLTQGINCEVEGERRTVFKIFDEFKSVICLQTPEWIPSGNLLCLQLQPKVYWGMTTSLPHLETEIYANSFFAKQLRLSPMGGESLSSSIFKSCHKFSNGFRSELEYALIYPFHSCVEWVSRVLVLLEGNPPPQFKCFCRF